VSRTKVMCEIDVGTRYVTRIFKHPGSALFLPPEQVAEFYKGHAVENIRRQVFAASKGECRNCGRPITWVGFHMHEQIPKSQNGEVSIYNSVALCAKCHLQGEHANRAPHFKRGPKNDVEQSK